MPIKTRSAKNKGKALQNHVRNVIKKRFSWLKDDDVISTTMGDSGVDIKLSMVARKTLPISFECKKTKATPSRGELEQSKNNAYGMTVPAVVWCPHGYGHTKSMIMFDFEDFLDWYEDVAQNRLKELKELYEED